jgi:hypothetical protein
MFQHPINAESYPVAQLCVNTLPATKVTLITDGIEFGTLRVNLSRNFKFRANLVIIWGTLNKDICTFMVWYDTKYIIYDILYDMIHHI